MRTSNKQLRGQARGGFTLLELMVTMLMMAMIAVALGTQLKAGFSATQKLEPTLEPYRSFSLAMDSVRMDIQNTLPPNPLGNTGSASGINIGGSSTSGGIAGATSTTVYLQGAFEGWQSTDSRGMESDEIQFCTTGDSPQHVDANGEVKQVTLQVVQDVSTGDFCLVRRVIRNQLAVDPPQPDEEILLRGVGSFTVTYYDGTEWDTSWDSTGTGINNDLPVAVMIQMQLIRPAAVTSNGRAAPTRTINFTKVFQYPCSIATIDPNYTATGGSGLPQ